MAPAPEARIGLEFAIGGKRAAADGGRAAAAVLGAAAEAAAWGCGKRRRLDRAPGRRNGAVANGNGVHAATNGSSIHVPGVNGTVSAEDEGDKGVQDLQALVVNLERRPDRMKRCASLLRAHCPWLHYIRMAASDGRCDFIPAGEVKSSWDTTRNTGYQILRSKRKGWNDLDTYRVCQLELSPGERGCALSHIRAWRCCLDLSGGGNRPLLVLEDDAKPTAEFSQTLQRAMAALPADADLLYLGYSQAAEWRRELSPELVESEYVWTTVAYIVWPRGARKLLSRLPVDQPVDNWMALACADNAVKAYCVRPKIVHQADAWNVNSDVHHSDEKYWGASASSDIQHSDDFSQGGGSDILHSDDRYWG